MKAVRCWQRMPREVEIPQSQTMGPKHVMELWVSLCVAGRGTDGL